MHLLFAFLCFAALPTPVSAAETAGSVRHRIDAARFERNSLPAQPDAALSEFGGFVLLLFGEKDNGRDTNWTAKGISAGSAFLKRIGSGVWGFQQSYRLSHGAVRLYLFLRHLRN